MKWGVLVVLVVGTLVGVGWVVTRVPPPPPPAVTTLRLTEGELGRFEASTQSYAPLPLGTEVGAELPLMSGGAGAVLRLSSGGVVAFGPQTAATVLAGVPGGKGGVTLRLDEGRIWLHLKGEEEVQVSSFRGLLEARRGDCEVRVFKDRDNFINTVAIMWRGQGALRGGDKLRVERPLSDGLTAHLDDVKVYPVTRFDPAATDPWQKRMLALP